MDNLQLVRELADRFGSQSIMVSLDIKKIAGARAGFAAQVRPFLPLVAITIGFA